MSKTRLEAFSDGVFAVSFITIGIIWVNHHAVFRQIWPAPARNWASRAGPALYATAVAVAFLNAYVSLGICAGLALYYALPQSIERQLGAGA